ncbi:MAG: C39 family peptidase [Ignavibacteria bacterium]
MKIFLLLFIINISLTYSQTYPDQHYFYERENLIQKIDSLDGMEVSSDGKSIILADGIILGTVIFKPDSSEFPFNRGLPSWNGFAPNNYSSFKVLMRFSDSTWSPWLTVGYWKENIWSSYGATSYNGGEIEVDYAVLNSFHTKWQFKIVMKRLGSTQPSPGLYKLSFFASDQRTTDNVNITSLVNEKPDPIFISTEHFYQNSLDPDIGSEICSPTSVSMVLRSYNIEVDPLKFAEDNYDDYWGMFGIWPRVVQNAAEYGLNGAVTRYRSWSDARKVLAAGGRVVMSVGSPLYPNGHLMMLAGFNAAGEPLVHDPAKSDGYGYKHNKRELSQSWFNKGGIAYTFFPEVTAGSTHVDLISSGLPEKSYLLAVYPNPFNPNTFIRFETQQSAYTTIIIYDITGSEVEKLYNDFMQAGSHIFRWNASNYPSGSYFIRAVSGNYNKTIKAVFIK